MSQKYNNCIEYLTAFSNGGPIEVSVKFTGSKAKVANQKMHPEEIRSLIDPTTGSFYASMNFDEHPATLKKIEIQPDTNKVIIHAVLQSGGS